MHNRFVDKKRRDINLRDMQVKNILPEHYGTYYPKFISLLERYYEFQDQESSTELLNHLFATRDVNETDITLLSYIEDELLLGEEYFQGFGKNDSELRAAANFSNILFRSKGTKFAIEWFFRSFYGEDVDVLYTKENIFKIGDVDSQIGPFGLKYLTDDKLYQTFALLVRTGISISKWKEVFKLFAHPAGMYLGGEVLIVDDVVTPITTLNDAIDAYTRTTYTITAAASNNEGVDWIFTVDSLNQRTNQDALYWYGEHLDTEDADFGVNFFNGDSGLPLSDSPQYLEMNNGQGSFTIKTLIDLKGTDPLAPTNEQFKIYIKDRSDRIVAEMTCDLVDVIPNWQLSVLPSATVNEGDTLTFTMTGNKDELPYNGENILRWYLDEGASDLVASDFENVTAISVATAEEFTVTSSAPEFASGSFNVRSLINTGNSGDQTATFRIINANGVEVGSQVITLEETSVVVTVTVPSTIEGNSIVANVIIGDYAEGDTLAWQFTGNISSDFRLSDASGSSVYSHNGGSGINITIPTTSSDIFQGTVTGAMEITDTTILGTAVGTSASFNFTDQSSVYNIIANPTTGGAIPNETITYTFGGTNIPDGEYYFYVEFNDLNPNNFASGDAPRIIGSTAISAGSHSTGITTITCDTTEFVVGDRLIVDGVTPSDYNGGEDGSFVVTSKTATTLSYTQTVSPGTFVSGGTVTSRLRPIAMSGNSGSTTLQFNGTPPSSQLAFIVHLATTNTASPNDVAELSQVTSGTPPSIVGSPTSQQEGEDITFTVLANGFAPGTWKYWFVGDITANDISTPYGDINNKQDFTVDGLGDGEIVVSIVPDQNREGNETFSLVIGSAAIGNPPVAQSNTVTIIDSSTPTTTVSNYTSLISGVEALTVTEDDNLYIGVTSTGNQLVNIPFTVTISGAGAAKYTSSSEQITNPVMGGGTSYVTFTAMGDDGTPDGPRDIDITVTENQSSTEIATKTITLNDAAVGYQLNYLGFDGGGVGGTVDEGSEINFEIVANNVTLPQDVQVRLEDFITQPTGLLNNGLSQIQFLRVFVGVDANFNIGDEAWISVGGIPTFIGIVTAINGYAYPAPAIPFTIVGLDRNVTQTTGTYTIYFIDPDEGARSFNVPWINVNVNESPKPVNINSLAQTAFTGDKTYNFELYETEDEVFEGTSTPTGEKSLILPSIDPTTVITINHPATTVNITPTNIVSSGNVEATAGFTLYSNGNMTASPSSGDTPVVINPSISINDWLSSQVNGVGGAYQVQAYSYVLGQAPVNKNALGVTGFGSSGLWANFGNQWHRLNSQFTISLFSEQGDLERDIQIEIKEYSGTLGTGNTVFGPYTISLAALTSQ